MKVSKLNVRKLDDQKFELDFHEDGKPRSFTITQDLNWVEEIQQSISTYTCEESEFYSFWGNAEFRQMVSKAVTDLTAKPELQAA